MLTYLFDSSKKTSSQQNYPEYGIVLDLDETIIHTYPNTEGYKKLYSENRKLFNKLSNSGTINVINYDFGDVNDDRLWFIVRPGLKEFLKALDKYFTKVIIWSAGTKEYVDDVVDIIFDNLTPPDKIYSRKDLLNKRDGSFEKPLRKIFRDIKTLNLSNTLIIDNLESNFVYSNKYNGISIPHFQPTINEIISNNGVNDRALFDLVDWFNDVEFNDDRDVREMEKRFIFRGNSEKENQPPPKIIRKGSSKSCKIGVSI